MAIYSLFALSVIIETKSMESNTWMRAGLWRTVQICVGVCRHAEFAWETSKLVKRHRNLFGSDTNLTMEYGLPQLE